MNDATPANPWHQFLFGPVAAIRPFLFARLLLALFTLDLWFTFIGRAAVYGAGGFDVAHLGWLDRIQPTPSPQLYVALLIVVSFASLTAALAGVHRGLLLVAAAFYGYAYLMSQHDGYQHHYLLGLLLFAVAFFPNVSAAEADPRTAAGSLRQPADSPRISAWAYAFIAAQVAVVYMWTAIAKMDATWIGGHVVRRIFFGAGDARIDDSQLMLTLSQTNIWPLIAVGAIVMELALVVGYLYAVTQDRRSGRWPPRIGLLLWAIAVMLHAGIMLMPLSIGLFSYYMLILASVYLLPLGLLNRVGLIVIVPARWVSRGVSALGGSRGPAIALTLIAAVALTAVAFTADMPGAAVGGIIAVFMLLAALGCDLWRGSIEPVARRALAALAFTAAMLIAVHWLNLPFTHWANMARYVQLGDHPPDALPLYRRALTHVRPGPDAAYFYNNYGELLGSLGDVPQALRYYQLAIAAGSTSILPYSNAADIMLALKRHREAIDLYRQALTKQTNDATLHHDLGHALQLAERSDEALAEYQRAVELDPDLFEARNNLAAMHLAAGRLDDAAVHLRHLLRIKPHDVQALNNLAWLTATSPNASPDQLAEALTFATRAAELTRHAEPVVLGTLAEVHHRTGHGDEALRTVDQAIDLATKAGHDRLAAQLADRRRRYATPSSP